MGTRALAPSLELFLQPRPLSSPHRQTGENPGVLQTLLHGPKECGVAGLPQGHSSTRRVLEGVRGLGEVKAPEGPAPPVDGTEAEFEPIPWGEGNGLGYGPSRATKTPTRNQGGCLGQRERSEWPHREPWVPGRRGGIWWKEPAKPEAPAPSSHTASPALMPRGSWPCGILTIAGGAGTHLQGQDLQSPGSADACMGHESHPSPG